MNKTSRRTFISTVAAAGAVSLGNVSGCGKPAPEKPVAKKTRNHPLDGIERENIKITDVKVTPLTYHDPNENLWRCIRDVTWKTDASLCEIFTDQGIVGIGEGRHSETSSIGEPHVIKKYTEEIIKPQIVGKNPFDVELLTCGGTEQVSSSSWAGVDVALWDIIGKAKNMPVYKLLATDKEPDPHVWVYASGGVQQAWYDNGDETLINEALSCKEQGYAGFKFRIGTDWEFSNMTLEKWLPIVRRMREAVGPDFKLMHESFWGTVPVERIIKEACPVLEELNIYWFEGAGGNYEDRLLMRAAAPSVLFADNEGSQTRFQCKERIDRNYLDIIQTDCSFSGITENWYISRIAYHAGKLHIPHNWHGGLTTMGNAHFVAGIPNRKMIEYNINFNPLHTEVFKEPLVVVNGYMDVPDKPGLGMELAPDLEKKFPYVPSPPGWRGERKPNPRML